jgi:hypothetical protein
MNAADKEKIRLLRGDGLGYKAIAAKLELSSASVKSFCQRNGLAASGDDNAGDACLQCGEPLGKKRPGAENKKFCSTACRITWWNRHAHLREPKEKDRRVCAYCRRVFYDRKPRKYCGVPCSAAARFGGDRRDAGTVRA